MKPVTIKQIALITGSLLLIVLLLLANTKPPVKKTEAVAGSEHADHDHSSPDISTLIEGAKGQLSAGDKQVILKLEEELKTSANKKTAFENIVSQWDSLRQPIAAAFYMEQAAEASPTAINWKEAGDRYYSATRFGKEGDRGLLFSRAIECYEHSLQLEPENTEAKISLASCYVEGTGDPMKGIGMLREIEKTDSTNINLQLNLAFFSERSGQWDKAIARFEKVLKIQPDFIEAYLHLADAYQQKGDKVKAIENLEKYVSVVDDITIKTEIRDYINKLRNS
ncbi:MAG: tetratricopeptide repeat protein [Bacteroidota bacterium]|nr:tetratricopeptide repeat protein [Bacteroidota bacterium]